MGSDSSARWICRSLLAVGGTVSPLNLVRKRPSPGQEGHARWAQSGLARPCVRDKDFRVADWRSKLQQAPWQTEPMRILIRGPSLDCTMRVWNRRVHEL
jgi:hypothetical protein